jgi:phage terminase Nu1 subunit (DNA packaging protein)
MSEFPNVFDRIEPLLDSDQAAAIVKVNKKTLQRHARNGLVVGLRVGKLWRFRASDLIPHSPDKDRSEDDLDDERRAQ